MSPRIRGRLRHRGGGGEPERVEIEPGALAGVFAAPTWLRDLGVAAWLLVGVTVLLVGAIWLLSLTQTIVIPVTVAAILAAVLSPLVGYLERRRVSRAAGSVLVFVLVLVLGLAFGVLVLNGITSQSGSLTGHLQDAADEIQGWLENLGVNADTAESAKDDASSSVSGGFHGTHRRPRDRHQRARVHSGVPRLHRAQPLLPTQGRTPGSGLGESATSASPSPWRARSSTAPPGRCGATSPARPSSRPSTPW